MRFEIGSDQAIVVLHDVALPPPEGEPRGSGSAFRQAARQGKLFFLEAEDPLKCRIDVQVGEEPEGPAHDFQPLGGSFRLELPTGVLAVRAYEDAASPATLAVAPGAYVVQVHEPPEFDGARHEREMIALVGERDWRFRGRVDWLGCLGCLPIACTFGIVLVARWRWPLLYMLPLTLLAALPHFLFRRTRRYREANRRIQEHERARPHWVVTLTAASPPPRIDGGFVAV